MQSYSRFSCRSQTSNECLVVCRIDRHSSVDVFCVRLPSRKYSGMIPEQKVTPIQSSVSSCTAFKMKDVDCQLRTASQEERYPPSVPNHLRVASAIAEE